MPSIIILDTGPLSNAAVPLAKSGKAPLFKKSVGSGLVIASKAAPYFWFPASATTKPSVNWNAVGLWVRFGDFKSFCSAYRLASFR